MVSAYNDWHIDEWAGSYPDRFIPIAVLPTWNPEAMCAEIRRVAAKGCRAVTMPELPHLEGLPSYHDDEYWGPVFRTLSEENVVMCLHIGTGFGAISMAPNAPIDNLIILATQVSAMCAQDLLWGPAMRNYPDLKFAFSEGGIGWIPFYLDRSDRHYTNQKWLRRDFGDKLPSDVFREHSLACYVTDKTSLKLRHEIGIDIIAWECDYPHSDCFWPDAPEQVLAELNAAGADDTDINKITWQNSCRFFGWDPFARTPKEQATVGALRAKGADVDVSIRPRKEWARLYAREAARQGIAAPHLRRKSDNWNVARRNRLPPVPRLRRRRAGRSWCSRPPSLRQTYTDIGEQFKTENPGASVDSFAGCARQPGRSPRLPFP